MQHIYMHSHEHFEVFTTVLAPQGRCRFRTEAEKMVVVHSYRPHWPDELDLSPGDVILVLSKHEEERWFGRGPDGQQGYFPSSCVMELSQSLSPQVLQRSLSVRTSAWDHNHSGARTRNTNGHTLQALWRGSRGGAAAGGGGEGGAAGPDGGQGQSESPFLGHRPLQVAPPQPGPSSSSSTQQQQQHMYRSPGLLHRILSKCRRRSECQGATNGAFESD